MINSILFAQLGNKVNEIRNDNIGFYQGDYPEVTNVSDRFQTNPFEQINYAIVQQLTNNYPELSAFLFGNPDKQYVIGDGPSNIGGGKAGRPRIHKGERAMTLNTASRRNQIQTTGDAALMAENRINPRTGNSIAYDKQGALKRSQQTILQMSYLLIQENLLKILKLEQYDGVWEKKQVLLLLLLLLLNLLNL